MNAPHRPLGHYAALEPPLDPPDSERQPLPAQRWRPEPDIDDELSSRWPVQGEP